LKTEQTSAGCVRWRGGIPKKGDLTHKKKKKNRPTLGGGLGPTAGIVNGPWWKKKIPEPRYTRDRVNGEEGGGGGGVMAPTSLHHLLDWGKKIFLHTENYTLTDYTLKGGEKKRSEGNAKKDQWPGPEMKPHRHKKL